MIELRGTHRRREPTLGVALCLGVTCLTWGCGGATNDAGARLAPRKASAAAEVARPDRTSIDDEDIAVALRQRLGRDGAIDVEVVHGVATLTGTVDHLLARRHATEIAAHTRGVVAVDDRLDVRPTQRADDEIEHDVARALALHPSTAGSRLDAQVRESHAYVDGRVDTIAAHRIALELAAGVRGVSAVTSSVLVVPALERGDDALRADVFARLLSDVRVDPRGIEVQVDEGRIVLLGVVGSEAERRIAERIASVCGARAVDASGLQVRWWARDELRRPVVDAPSDDALAGVVSDAITQELGVPREAVRVRVHEGTAILEGNVESVATERDAIEIAMHTVGITRVDDRLGVLPYPLISDEALEERVAELLGMSPYLSSAPVDIRARRGVVSLVGAVESSVARREADRIAAQLAGVRGVDNRIEVDARRAMPDDGALVAEIRGHLASCPFLAPLDLQVEVDDGVATLRGEVDDVRAYREAEREALDAGAIEVVNQLRVRAMPPVSESIASR